MQNNKKRNGSFLSRIEKKITNIGKSVNIMERNTMARIISDEETDEIAEMIRLAQSEINNEIRYKAKQILGNVTRFDKNNLIVSLSEKEETKSNEIFEPFIDKGYTVVSLSDNYEPFKGYNVYLVSWK